MDQTLPPEELLAALEALQDEVDGLAQESIGVKLAMQSAFLDIQVAPTPKDAMDAYALFVEGYQGLRRTQIGRVDGGPEIETCTRRNRYRALGLLDWMALALPRSKLSERPATTSTTSIPGPTTPKPRPQSLTLPRRSPTSSGQSTRH